MANSTPNYGYDSDIAAISGIDRNLKRVEDKTDANTSTLVQQLVQITRSEDGIACLDKRVDKLESIPATMCCKTDIDCLLAKKADKCDFDMHLKDPDAHKKLFDQKVDKKDGCRLICEDELQQIRDDIDDRYTKDETYPREKLYTQDEVDSFLARKANHQPSALYKLTVGTDFNLLWGYYYKNNVGDVIVNFRVSSKLTMEAGQDYLVGTLPEGFRCSVSEWCGTVAQRYSGSALPHILVTQSDGNIILHSGDSPGAGTSFYGFLVIPTGLIS